MRDPKAIRKAIMAARSVAAFVDPKFARVPLPDLGMPAPEVVVPEHSPAMHEAFGVPMPKGYARGGLPTLKPAIRHKGKVYTSVVDHMSALSGIEDPEERQAAKWDADNRGYVNERGHFLDRYRAQGYAKDHGLISPNAPEWAHSSPELISENLLRYSDQEERNKRLLEGGYAAGGEVDDSIIAYHGTNRDFNDFDMDQRRGGITFTTDKSAADHYAQDRARKLGGKPRTVKVRLKVNNPLHSQETNYYVDDVNHAKNHGHDAVIGPVIDVDPEVFPLHLVPKNITVWDSKNVEVLDHGRDQDHYAAGGEVEDENPYAQPNNLGLYSHAAVTAAGLP
ncbi:MAG: hypothetical protein EBS87_11240, partial [Sphingomonadaceae bacterium]|nr:hypothetical protein [Sphingomonadaceae bacterium]